MKLYNVKYPIYGMYAENTAEKTTSYTGGRVISKMMKIDTKFNAPATELFGDGGIDTRKLEFVDGTVTAGVTEMSHIVRSELLGRTVTTETINGKTIYVVEGQEGDQPPYVGFGCYGVGKLGSVEYFRGIWLPKVQFGPPGDSLEQEEKQIKWQTPTIEGAIIRDIRNRYIYDAYVSDEDTIIAWLNARAGIGSVIDKTILNALIDSYSDLVEADYTAGTWATFEDALTDAQAISANTSATQQEVFDSVNTIADAFKGLVEA